MSTLTSQLVIELLDRVTGPARRAANALAGISNTIREQNGQPITFGDRLNAAITRNDRALEQARGGIVDAVASFYALRQAIGAPIEAAAAFESAMADVIKVVDFPTPEAFTQFQQDLFALSREIPIAVNGLAEIAAAAGQAGIAGQDLIRFTDAAARIGVAFDISAEQAGGSMANLMTALNLSIDETVSLADAMNHLSNSQASTAADILDVVQRVGAQATMFGFTAEQTSAFASAMLAAGSESDVAATSFRNMGAALTRGSSATRAQRDAFRELGLDAERVARSMQENAVETTIDVLRRIGQLPAEQRAAISSQLFGNEARALGPLLTNLGLVEETLGMVGDRANYAGSAFAEFQARNNTFQANMQRFQNVLTELQISIGNALMPAISQLAEAVAPLITRLAELANAYPEVTLAVVGATGAVIAFKGAIAALRFAGLVGRGGVLSMIALGYNTIGRAAIGARIAATEMIGLQSALAAMAGQPLGTLGRLRAGLSGIVLAIPGVSALSSGIAAIGAAVATISAPVWGTFAAIAAAVAAAGFTIYRYWDRISAVFAGVGQAIGEALQPGLEWVGEKLAFLNPVVDVFGAAWGAVRDRLSGLGEMIGGLFTREVLTEEQTAGITARAREVTENIIGFFTGIPARLGEVAVEWFNAGRDLIQSIWDGMIPVFAGVGQAIGEALQPGLDWVSEKLSFLNPVVTAFGDAWQWVRGRVSGLGELLSGLFDRETLSEEEVASITARAREVTENIIRWFTGLPARIGEAAGELVEAGRQLIQSLWDGAVEKFDEFVAWLTGIPGRIVEAIGNIDLSSIIRGPSPQAWWNRLMGGSDAAMDGFQEDFGVDGKRAKGGPISRGSSYLVGEDGPELITANRNGYVNPTGQGAMGGSLEVSINAPITVNGGVSDPQQLAAEISRQMRDEVREAFRGVFADTGMRFA